MTKGLEQTRIRFNEQLGMGLLANGISIHTDLAAVASTALEVFLSHGNPKTDKYA